jgi:hypothetical protein
MKAGGAVTYTIPKCIASGYYLVRHEIIALHSAYSYPGAQFYPVSRRRTSPWTGLGDADNA